MRPVKKWMKLILDGVALVLLALMYRKQAVSMAFHEIGGLALIALFIVHHLFNGKWITAVASKLFSRQLPKKTYVSAVVDTLLLLCFLCIGVSGALISKTVFSFGVRGGGWKTLHYFCSALALALGGVHIGLHATYLFGWLRKSGKSARFLATALLVALLIFGVYSLPTTSYFRWISMPFTASVEAGHGSGAGYGKDAANGALPTEGMPTNATEHPGAGQGNGSGQGKNQGNGAGQGRMAQGGTFQLGNVLLTIAQFLSIATVFAGMTYGVERVYTRKKKPEPPSV